MGQNCHGHGVAGKRHGDRCHEFDSGGLSRSDSECHEWVVVEFGDPETVITKGFESFRLSSDPVQIHGS